MDHRESIGIREGLEGIIPLPWTTPKNLTFHLRDDGLLRLSSIADSNLSEFCPDLEIVIYADVIKKLRRGIDLVVIPSSRKAGQFMDVIR